MPRAIRNKRREQREFPKTIEIRRDKQRNVRWRQSQDDEKDDEKDENDCGNAVCPDMPQGKQSSRRDGKTVEGRPGNNKTRSNEVFEVEGVKVIRGVVRRNM